MFYVLSFVAGGVSYWAFRNWGLPWAIAYLESKMTKQPGTQVK